MLANSFNQIDQVEVPDIQTVTNEVHNPCNAVMVTICILQVEGDFQTQIPVSPQLGKTCVYLAEKNTSR